MNGLSAKLDHLEARLRALIEGNLSGLMPEKNYQDALIQRMVMAMKTGSQTHGDGSSMAPDIYILLVNPENQSELEIRPGLLEEFADIIREAGENAGLKFYKPPIVLLSPNPEILVGSIDVIARNSQEVLHKTVKNEVDADGEIANFPANTFFIVNGSRIFPLDKPIINIGRRATNDLVIDDMRVSRDHAQMRAIRGVYVLFDLNSTGGTFVNGHRISQRSLTPRDVISLAGIPLVYGQDTYDSHEMGQTQKMHPSFEDDMSTYDSEI